MTLLISLLIIGFFLIFVEMIIPGMIVGLIGVGCLIGAIFVSFMQFGIHAGLTVLLIEIVFGFILFFLWSKYFFKTKIGSRLVLQRSLDNPPQTHEELLGKIGKSLTPLRPSGTAEINGKKFDVLSQGKLIEVGTDLEVVSVKNNIVFVRELKEQPKPKN